MTKSIISNKRECYKCKTTYNIHIHHIYGSTGRRKLSDKYGCWVYLCGAHHNLSNKGVHFDKDFDKELKKECQKRWEEIYGSREDFRKVFRKSYL